MHTSNTSGNTPNQSATRFLQTQNVSRDISPFTFEGFDIRIISIDDEPWFVAKDIADVLGYGNPQKAVRDHCKAHRPVGVNESFTLDPQTNIIPERDVYRLIMRSKLPAAERFEEWVVSDVLPSIRKTGGYAAPAVLPSYAETLRLYADQIEQTQLVTLERDHAVATKAEIGSRREATAMATASAAVREANRLKAELGRNAEFATITAVENATDEKLGKQAFRPLRTYCNEHGPAPMNVADARYGSVKAWPAIAWKQTYGIDLAEVFGGEA
jgi:prophage antirepressor-like protein